MLQFIIGLVIGMIVGFVFASLFAVSNCADCQSQKYRDFYDSEDDSRCC